MAAELDAAVGEASRRSPADVGGEAAVVLCGEGGRVGASVVVVVVEGAIVEAKSTSGGRAKSEGPFSSSEEEPAGAGNTMRTFSSSSLLFPTTLMVSLAAPSLKLKLSTLKCDGSSGGAAVPFRIPKSDSPLSWSASNFADEAPSASAAST